MSYITSLLVIGSDWTVFLSVDRQWFQRYVEHFHAKSGMTDPPSLAALLGSLLEIPNESQAKVIPPYKSCFFSVDIWPDLAGGQISQNFIH